VSGTLIPAHEACPGAQGRYPVAVVVSGFAGNSEHHEGRGPALDTAPAHP
jgi:hypothetical protein